MRKTVKSQNERFLLFLVICFRSTSFPSPENIGKNAKRNLSILCDVKVELPLPLIQYLTLKAKQASFSESGKAGGRIPNPCVTSLFEG